MKNYVTYLKSEVDEFLLENANRVVGLEADNKRLNKIVKELQCCGNCEYSNYPSDERSNAGCLGCIDTRSEKKVYLGWKQRSSK